MYSWSILFLITDSFADKLLDFAALPMALSVELSSALPYIHTIVTIDVIIAVAIAPYVIGIVGIPLLMAGMTLIPAIFIGIVISLIYKAYCAIRNKK